MTKNVLSFLVGRLYITSILIYIDGLDKLLVGFICIFALLNRLNDKQYFFSDDFNSIMYKTLMAH